MEDENNIFYLCGGTFFTLIIQAAKQGYKERKKFGDTSSFTGSDVLEKLIKVAVPNYKKPEDKGNFNSVVSAYKSCNVKKTARLPIHNPLYISDFDNKIKNDYYASLIDMNDFVCLYIEEGAKTNWLVKALLELIEFDASIKEDDIFYVGVNLAIKKSDFIKKNEICLANFLLAIWHFIVKNRQNNDIGKETYDKWCPKGISKNTREDFFSSIGEKITRKITIIPFDSSKISEISYEAPEDSETIENSENPEEIDLSEFKHITVNNNCPVQNQRFLSINTMNGDIHL